MDDKELNTLRYGNNRVLYRYRTIARAEDEISKEYIHMTCPSKFNDPFDCWLSLEGCDDDIRQKIRESGLDDSDILADAMCGDRLGIVTGMYLGILDRVRICCFSERNDSLSMWTHYGEEHSGICIGYDYWNMRNLDILPAKVNYSTEMKVKPFLNGYRKLQSKDIYGAFTNKSTEYETDKEWRVVRYADQNDDVKVNGCINSIYIGASCRNLSDEEKDSMNSIVDLCETRNTPVYLMRRSFTNYKLEPALIYGPGNHDLCARSSFELFMKHKT